jgi:glutaredoxin 2
MEKPAAFLTPRVHNVSIDPSLTGLCVGYEDKKWRYMPLVESSLAWLPEFALKESERAAIASHNCVELMRKAARKVYKSKKFANRGEFGELFLHIATRELFDSIPAISKIYYKSSRNDTVKGFDSVHVVQAPNEEFELWLGESKFYSNATDAARDVVKELHDHSGIDFLRDEFLVISDYIDDASEFADELKELISTQTSIDDIFSRVRIPVFLTYESDCVSKHENSNAAYKKQFEDEISKLHEKFCQRDLPENLSIHLFLMPLAKKAMLVKALDDKLKVWQTI